MYCQNCGKQTSDAASFCPYCGAKRTENTQENQNIQVHNNEMVKKASNVRDYIENEEEIPVYKRKNKVAFLVGFIPFIYVVLCLVYWLYKYGNYGYFWRSGINKEDFYYMKYFMMFVAIGAGTLAYSIATSKVNSKTIIKKVLIETAICAFLSIGGIMIGGIGVAVGFLGYYLFFSLIIGYSSYLGKQTGNKFNFFGFCSLVAYLFSLFGLPIISNKYEDSYIYALVDKLVKDFDGKLIPSQYGILNFCSEISADSVKYLQILFFAIIVCSVLFLYMIFFRKNAAQVVIGSTIAVLTAGMLYFDYNIFHSKSLAGKLARDVLSKLGFSLSAYVFIILGLPILMIITSYICNKKDKENKQ